MAQISGSDEVYRLLVDDPDVRWEFGLLAFAIIEEKRFEWMKHFEEHNGGKPSIEEIRHWYEQQPENVLVRAKADAENALKLYADEVLQDVLDVERREVADGIVVSEIRAGRRFWPQFGVNLAGGFTSALLFAAILTILAMVVWVNPSPIDFGKGIVKPQMDEGANGKTSTQ